jgi:hydroxymethylpyrimidine pyrophosphatase-like HAD family hydrolase
MTSSQEITPQYWKQKPTPEGLFVTDFDGTFLRSDRTFAEEDLLALKKLGAMNITRVIATGRSIYSFNTVVGSDLPVDFVIFSTGAGVTYFPSGKIVRKISLDAGETRCVSDVLLAARLDFMIHRPIPDNHHFSYVAVNSGNSDFEQRIALYEPFAIAMNKTEDGYGPATQLLAVLPPSQNMEILDELREKLSDFNVIQTTSPLDGKSTWIEIFPASVSKSQTAEWLAKELNVEPSNIVSLGNDYNDIDLLEWSPIRYVVKNAPADLKARFPSVASNNNCAVAEAVERWLSQKKAHS